jgi:hypothetical protein
MVSAFEAFQAKIDAITAAIGEPTVRPYVADVFADTLRDTMRDTRRAPSYGKGSLPWGLEWTLATQDEFAEATQRGDAHLCRSQFLPPKAQGRWRGTVMTLRDDDVWIERGGYRLLVASAFIGTSSTYDRASGTYITKWQISINRRYESKIGCSSSGPKMSHAKEPDAAIKTLRRMVKDLVGCDLANVNG